MRLFCAFAILLLAADCARAGTIRVAAAISMKEALTEIGKGYEAEAGGKVEFTFGSSGQLAAQIKAGAAIDLFISAADKQVDDLVQGKHADPATRRVIAGNTLVLVVPAGAKGGPASFEALGDASVGRIAVGEPKTVPAGMYARQVFDSLKLSDRVKPKLVYGTNVRQVLVYVERGEVAAGIVYATDAVQSGDKVKVVATADAKSHDLIVYPAVVVTTSKQRGAAERFLRYLSGDKAGATLEAKGFAPPPPATTEPAPRATPREPAPLAATPR